MFYVTSLAKVVKVEADKVLLKCLLDGQEFSSFLRADQVFDLKEDDEGIFIGELRNNKFLLERVDLRKFLDPLYQEDLLRSGAIMKLVDLIDDPFPAVFKDYLEYEKTKTPIPIDETEEVEEIKEEQILEKAEAKPRSKKK